jgi:uncharacterized protein (TIGR02118 family)
MPRKLIFVVYKLPELSTRDFAAEWGGDRHTSLVGQIPGLVRWVQNHVSSADAPDAPDGIGELWFDTDETLSAAMTSAEMGAAVEDARKFLDMERTYAIPVTETTVVGAR